MILSVPFHYSNLQQFFSFRHRISSYRQTNRYADLIPTGESKHTRRVSSPKGQVHQINGNTRRCFSSMTPPQCKSNHSCANIGKYFDIEIAWTVHEEDRLHSGKRLIIFTPKVQDNIQDRCILESSSGFECLTFLIQSTNELTCPGSCRVYHVSCR